MCKLNAGTGARIASSGPCGRQDNAMCDAGTAVPVQGGGLCVMLTVSYEKDLVNFIDYCCNYTTLVAY